MPYATFVISIFFTFQFFLINEDSLALLTKGSFELIIYKDRNFKSQ